MELAGPASGVFFAGNDNTVTFTVTVDGTAIDIEGMTFRFVMARTPVATAALSTEVSPATATAAESDAENGEFDVSWTDTDSAALIGTYQYQAQVEDLSGNKSNVLHGYFTFKENMIP